MDSDTTTAITGFPGAAPDSCILRQSQELRSAPKKAAKELRRRAAKKLRSASRSCVYFRAKTAAKFDFSCQIFNYFFKKFDFICQILKRIQLLLKENLIYFVKFSARSLLIKNKF
jgi:hypothetical protein